MEKVQPVFKQMAECGMPLLVHSEVATQTVDIFEREPVFIELIPVSYTHLTLPTTPYV